MSKVIHMKDFTPYYYTTSRDYQVILAMFDLLINTIKTDIDSIPDNLDPYKCNNKLLELLASYVGYDYDYSESYEANRLIISNYINMIQNRGNKIGLSMAAALSFNAAEDLDRVEELNMFSIEYIKSENKVAVYIYYPVYLNKIRDLLERVRPIGVGLELIPAYEITGVETLEVHDYYNNDLQPYDNTRRDVSENSRVGYTEVTDKNEPHQ